MNKQQLANKIWESANRMRSKIEANEYKDYILGFIFYKFLSDKEVDRLKKDGYGEDDIRSMCMKTIRKLWLTVNRSWGILSLTTIFSLLGWRRAIVSL